MAVLFQKNFRISVFDLILIGMSVPDLLLKISLKNTQTKKLEPFSMFTFGKIEIFSC